MFRGLLALLYDFLQSALPVVLQPSDVGISLYSGLKGGITSVITREYRYNILNQLVMSAAQGMRQKHVLRGTVMVIPSLSSKNKAFFERQSLTKMSITFKFNI